MRKALGAARKYGPEIEDAYLLLLELRLTSSFLGKTKRPIFHCGEEFWELVMEKPVSHLGRPRLQYE